jgi:hypothetical protein
MRLKFLAAAAAIATSVAGPASARVYHHHVYHHHYRGVGPVGAAAGIAGLAIGTAGAIATAPVRDSYGYYGYDRGYDPYYGPGPNYGPRW